MEVKDIHVHLHVHDGSAPVLAQILTNTETIMGRQEDAKTAATAVAAEVSQINDAVNRAMEELRAAKIALQAELDAALAKLNAGDASFQEITDTLTVAIAGFDATEAALAPVVVPPVV